LPTLKVDTSFSLFAEAAKWYNAERRLRDAGPVDTDTAAGIILPAIDAAMREIRAIRCD